MSHERLELISPAGAGQMKGFNTCNHRLQKP
jgi:hypothetical protein